MGKCNKLRGLMENIFETLKVLAISMGLMAIKVLIDPDKALIWRDYFQDKKLNIRINILINVLIYLGCAFFGVLIFLSLVHMGFGYYFAAISNSFLCMLLPQIIRGFSELADKFSKDPLHIISIIKNFRKK